MPAKQPVRVEIEMTDEIIDSDEDADANESE
jgi:hypothetical protein